MHLTPVLRALAAILLIVFSALSATAQPLQPVPALTGHVVDTTGTLEPARQATTISRVGWAASNGMTATSAASVRPAATAMAGRKVTPRPEPTICTRVGSEVAANASSSPVALGGCRPQALTC